MSLEHFHKSLGEMVALGEISGYAPFMNIGYSPTVNTTESSIWAKAGVYSFPTAEALWEVVSSDNTQDIGTVIKGDATGDTVESDGDGTTTTLEDDSVDFTAATAVAAGDCVILDPHGTTPEWGYVTGVAANTLTIAGGFSSGGTGASRKYAVVDKSAHTHAQVVKVDYLDDDFTEHTELIVLNGTTVVDAINTDFYRCNSFRVIATGSSNKTLGNLTLRIDGGAGDVGYIAAGFVRSRNAMYTVPTGKTLYINEWIASWSTPNDSKVQSARLMVTLNREPATFFNTGALFYMCMEVMVTNNQVVMSCNVPNIVYSGTDIRVSGIAETGGNGPATSMMRGFLVTT